MIAVSLSRRLNAGGGGAKVGLWFGLWLEYWRSKMVITGSKILILETVEVAVEVPLLIVLTSLTVTVEQSFTTSVLISTGS